MPLLSRRAARYARAWLRGPGASVTTEVTLDRNGTPVRGTLVRPPGGPVPRPAWVVLHGMTPAGAAHAQLRRFTEALVATGAVALVPEVPEWRALRLAPHLAGPTVAAGIAGLREHAGVGTAPVGVIGFSFGAPHGIAAAADPSVADSVAGAVGFGGYGDIESTLRFLLTGVADEAPPVAPEPYGRWIVGANYLTAIPELTDHADVSEALAALAAYAGARTGPVPLESYDTEIARQRARIARGHRPIFDLLAPPSTGRRPDPDAAGLLAAQLAEAALVTDPFIDPVPRLGTVRCPVHIVHGRGDRLIPSSEAPKIQRALPSGTWSRVTITRLFGHSTGDPVPLVRSLWEVPRFARALSGVLGVP